AVPGQGEQRGAGVAGGGQRYARRAGADRDPLRRDRAALGGVDRGEPLGLRGARGEPVEIRVRVDVAEAAVLALERVVLDATGGDEQAAVGLAVEREAPDR